MMPALPAADPWPGVRWNRMTGRRDPRNAPGDFYVIPGDCLICEIAEDHAPDLIRTTNHGCYFHRQPRTPDEVEQAIHAVRVSCAEAIRFGGSDATIVDRLQALGLGHCCDHDPGA